MLSHVPVPSPQQAYRGSVPPHMPLSPSIVGSSSSSLHLPVRTSPSAALPHRARPHLQEPYLDVLVSTSSLSSRPPTDPLSLKYSTTPQTAHYNYDSDVIYVPDLSHTGVTLSMSQGEMVGKNVKKAVRSRYPGGDHRAMMTMREKDVAKTGKSKTLRSTLSTMSAASSKSPYGAPPVSPIRKVVLVNTTDLDDPYIDSRGRNVKTKVHDLVYNKMFASPHRRRKTRFTGDLVKRLRDEREEFESRIPV